MNAHTILLKLVIFTVLDQTIKIFLIDNKLPKGDIESNISLDQTAHYIFETATGIPLQQQYIEQLYTIASEKTISIVYYILVPAINIKNHTHWKVMPESLDDGQIISYALQRLCWKMEYTNVVYSLLPEEFTLSDLQKTYEAILGKPLDKRNFRKKMLSLKFLKSTGKKNFGSARPAQMYKFGERKPVIARIFS